MELKGSDDEEASEAAVAQRGIVAPTVTSVLKDGMYFLEVGRMLERTDTSQ